MIFELANDSCNNFFSANSTGYKIPNFVGCLPAVLFTMFPANISWSSRHVLKTSSTRLQRINFSSSKTSWRRLANVFKTSCEMSSRRLGRQKIVTLKTSWRRLEDMYWRRLGDKQDVYWNICIKPWSTNKSKSVFNKSISHKSLFHQSKVNPSCIN